MTSGPARVVALALRQAGLMVAVLLLTPVVLPAQTAVDTTRPPAVVATAESRSPTTALRPGDVLRLRIWREEDLSGEFPVDEAGNAVLPRLGVTSVTGMSSDQLREQLVVRYREFLNNPSIEITPLRRIAILGAVQKPGIYPLEPSVRLGEAANVAGGPTPDSKRNRIELIRGTERQSFDLKAQPEKATLALASGDQVYLPQRSWLNRNATWFVTTLVGVAGTTAFLITR